MLGHVFAQGEVLDRELILDEDIHVGHAFLDIEAGGYQKPESPGLVPSRIESYLLLFQVILQLLQFLQLEGRESLYCPAFMQQPSHFLAEAHPEIVLGVEIAGPGGQ